MEYKGKREIKVDDAADAFSARAMSAILDDMELDFDFAVLDYADEEEMDVTIDGEEWVICYDQDEEGFHFHLITPEEFEDNYYEYAEYDDEDELDEFDFEDEDWPEGSDEDDDEYEGSRMIQASDNVSIFHIMSLASVLDNAGIDFELATIEQADNRQMTVDIDGETIVLGEQQDGENRFLTFLEDEEEEEEDDGEEPSDSRVIPFNQP